MSRDDRRLRPLLRLLLFPWFLWHVAVSIPRDLLRDRLGPGAAGRALILSLQVGCYSLIGLPATLILTGEVVIQANEALLAEQADYRLQSDFAAGVEAGSFDVPGPGSAALVPVNPSEGEAYRRYLVELYSPVIFHKVSNHPQWDIPLLMDFDGNDDPRDNVANEAAHRPHAAGVHGEVTAETADSYYLTYSLYHIKDYDHPVREMISRWTYHDNDNEGFHIRVDKRTMQVAEVETWFHNRFMLCNRTGSSTGSEPVHGRFYVEDGTHVIVYAQPQGHGVRCAQLVDRPHLDRNVKVLRYRADREPVAVTADGAFQDDATYELGGFDRWYELARGPFSKRGEGEGMFEGAISLGFDASGEELLIGRFIAGLDYDIDSWSRPKPMWSWDDGWDDIPVLVWHFFPSVAFESHGGTKLSHDYVYNRPAEKVFGLTGTELYDALDLELVTRDDPKWDHLQARGGNLGSGWYWMAAKQAVKVYVNYLFHALG